MKITIVGSGYVGRPAAARPHGWNVHRTQEEGIDIGGTYEKPDDAQYRQGVM
ncbi:hypothetical protein [Mesorhizobium sp. B2-1-3A]|uniref:hypothetical protein n=1 Tax=Mesorhizobium sp. B2-1-3A TaxID=2589971 RepID=UPI0015E2A7F0|nr:hypothetical protein [Mesorhizobium sp. B2-1-3A]